MKAFYFAFIKGCEVRLLAIDQIEEGMILAEDILSSEGSIYLGAGVVLKPRHRILLENLQVMFVYIQDASTPIALETSPKQVRRTKAFKKTLESFKTVYSQVSLGNKIVVDELHDAVGPLIEDILDDNDILGSLRKIEIADEYTFKHSINVSLIASMIGKWLKFDIDQLKELSIAALLHDLGKSRVPNLILNKPAKLSIEEFEVIKTHALLSYATLVESGVTSEAILRGVLEHHEKMDGTGYPNGLKAQDIHIYARIIAIADVFDAMTSDRCYHHKLSPFIVADEMLRASYNHLDIEITSVFIQNIAHFFVGNEVELSSGAIGEIILLNPYAITRPLIKLPLDYIDLAKRYDLDITKILK